MKLSQIEFTHQGKPCGSFRIRSIEEKIGGKLPEDYKKFIKTTGGGTLSLENTTLTGISLPDGEELEINVEQIFGNGHSEDDDNDLADYASFLAEEWEIPTKGLLIGNPGAGMHESFALNYDLEGFPLHSVLYLDNDEPGQFALVAPTFSDFLEMLQPSPDYDDEVSEYEGQKGLFLARKGPLGEELIKAINASSYADMESIVRHAAESIAIENRIEMYGGEKSFRFQDLMFFLSQPFGEHHSLETWTAPSGLRNDSINKADLLGESFLREDGHSALNSNESATERWWEDHVNSGVLIKTSQGYKLKSEYIDWLVNTYR